MQGKLYVDTKMWETAQHILESATNLVGLDLNEKWGWLGVGPGVARKAESKGPSMKTSITRAVEGGNLKGCSPVFVLVSFWAHERLYFPHHKVKRDRGSVCMTSSGHQVVTEVLYVTSGPKHRRALCPIPLLQQPAVSRWRSPASLHPWVTVWGTAGASTRLLHRSKHVKWVRQTFAL